jgi:hypothetical protein
MTRTGHDVRDGCARAVLLFSVCTALAIASGPGSSVLAAFQQSAAAQAKPALRIVVIEGEDGVNIIQQKTAVAPIVEVRDVNDLPVGGVVVTFTIQGGANAATFAGGVSQIAVTTNAAGRAVAAGLNPLASGPLQINVAATMQGQAATATISQVNFATAQAAQAAQAASTGGGTAGGGISLPIVAGAAGAAVLGTVVAATALSSPDCVFAVSPTSINAAGGGSTESVSVSVSPADCDPPTWSATSGVSFVTVTPANGSGSGAVTLSVASNVGGATRTGTVTIAGQTVTISQAAPCTFNVSTTSVGPLPGVGGSATVTVTPTPAGCSPTTWTASSSSAFITVSPTSGSGAGTATVTAAANTTGAQRTGTVTIAGRSVSVVQNQSFPPCNTTNAAGGGDATYTYELGRTTGTFTFFWDTGGYRDRFILRYQNGVLFDTGCNVAANRSQVLNYSGATSTISVEVQAICASPPGFTGWSFRLSCPQ